MQHHLLICTLKFKGLQNPIQTTMTTNYYLQVQQTIDELYKELQEETDSNKKHLIRSKIYLLQRSKPIKQD